MNIDSRTKNSYSIIDIAGRINKMKDSLLLKSFVEELQNNNNLNIVLNLSKVTYLDSGALNVIITIRNQLEKKGKTLSLLSPNDYVEDLIDVIGLYKVIKIYNTEEEIEND